MTDSAGHALRWRCPECGVRLSSLAESPDAAQDNLVDLVRGHLRLNHPEEAETINALAAASWLAGEAPHVELYGGPFDGAQVWLPPGPLPDVLGAQLDPKTGDVVVARSATVRLLLGGQPTTYRLGERSAAAASGRPPRYLYDGRTQA